MESAYAQCEPWSPLRPLRAGKTAEGRYQNVSEVIRAGLRLLEDTEATNLERRAVIRAELAERANDGRPTQPAARVFEDLRAHHQSKVKADTHGA